jgi:hypothetical protein
MTSEAQRDEDSSRLGDAAPPTESTQPGRATSKYRPTARYLFVPPRKVPMRAIGVVALLASAAVVGTIVVMNGLESPADIARKRQPPKVKPVTVKVVRQFLEISRRDSEGIYRLVQRSEKPLLSVPITAMYPCATGEPGIECVHIESKDGEAFQEMRVKRIMTSTSGFAGIEQPTDSLQEGQVLLINKLPSGTSGSVDSFEIPIP